MIGAGVGVARMFVLAPLIVYTFAKHLLRPANNLLRHANHLLSPDYRLLRRSNRLLRHANRLLRHANRLLRQIRVIQRPRGILSVRCLNACHLMVSLILTPDFSRQSKEIQQTTFRIRYKWIKLISPDSLN